MLNLFSVGVTGNEYLDYMKIVCKKAQPCSFKHEKKERFFLTYFLFESEPHPNIGIKYDNIYI